MQHLANGVNLFFKIPSLLKNNSSVAKISCSTLIAMCFFTSFHNCLRGSIVSLLKSSFINIFVFLNLFAFCRTFTLSLYLSRQHIIVCGLFSLFVLFYLHDVRRSRSMSVGCYQVSPGTVVAVSLHNLPMSPLESLEYHLLSGYFSLTYTLDLLVSAHILICQFLFNLVVIYLFNAVFDIC